MRDLLIILSLFFIISGGLIDRFARVTEVEKIFYATSGSKADGIVIFSFDHYVWETPRINQDLEIEVYQSAKNRCANWGYSDASSFDEVTRDCVVPGATGCQEFRVKRVFQCLD